MAELHEDIWQTILGFVGDDTKAGSIQRELSSVEEKDRVSILNRTDNNGNTLFHKAAHYASGTNNVKILLKHTPAASRLTILRKENNEKQNCLEMASSQGRFTELLKSLKIGEQIQILVGQKPYIGSSVWRRFLGFIKNIYNVLSVWLLWNSTEQIIHRSSRVDNNYLHIYISNISKPFDKLYLASNLVDTFKIVSPILDNFTSFEKACFEGKPLKPITDEDGDSVLHILSALEKFQPSLQALLSLKPEQRKAVLTLPNRAGFTPQTLTRRCSKLQQLIAWSLRQDDVYYFPIPPSCLIFYGTENRPNAGLELNAIKPALERLGIEPEVNVDHTKDQIIQTIKSVQSRSLISGLIIVIMCHGHSGTVIPQPRSKRSERLFINTILKEMMRKNLKGKPKMLWVQACNKHPLRENSREVHNMPENADAIEGAANLGFQDPTIPGVDFSYISATISGEVAYRNVMIPKLAEILNSLKNDQDMAHICRELVKSVMEDSEQIPVCGTNCRFKICLKNIFQYRDPLA